MYTIGDAHGLRRVYLASNLSRTVPYSPGRSVTERLKSGIVPGQGCLYRRSTIPLPMINLAWTLTALRGLPMYPGDSYASAPKGLASVGCKFYRSKRSALALEGGYAKDCESEIR